MTAMIDTDRSAGRMRARIIQPDERRILVSRIADSRQESDVTSPTNCGGLGRIRHFRRGTSDDWPENFLPIDPACSALGLDRSELLEAQVFQNAACAWRCWYCYVPFEMLGGDERRGEWVEASELVTRYASLADRPPILDLSGGSPDLTPEWVLWTMEALEELRIADDVYLWSDDNLSTDYLFRHLAAEDLQRMARYRNYGRVGCFKGFDPSSFAFNTGANMDGYERQFDIFARTLDVGFDLYAYVTLTGPDLTDAEIEQRVGTFVERLARLDARLPFRTVPLRIDPFGPLRERPTASRFASADRVQQVAIRTWRATLASRSQSTAF